MSEKINQLKNKNTFLFDMDGTLVNTEFLHAKAASSVLIDLKINIKLEENIDKFYGMADTEVLKMLMPNITQLEIEKIIGEKNHRLTKLLKELTAKEKEQYITPGLFEFMDHLLDQNKTCAVVSASEDVIVYETLSCFGIDKKIKLQMGRNQTSRTKPFPDPYLEAIKRLNSKVEDTVIFEDSPTGMQSALATGCDVFRVNYFAHCSNVLNLNGKYTEIRNFNDFF